MDHLGPRLVQKFVEGETSHELGWKVKVIEKKYKKNVLNMRVPHTAAQLLPRSAAHYRPVVTLKFFSISQAEFLFLFLFVPGIVTVFTWHMLSTRNISHLLARISELIFPNRGRHTHRTNMAALGRPHHQYLSMDRSIALRWHSCRCRDNLPGESSEGVCYLSTRVITVVYIPGISV